MSFNTGILLQAEINLIYAKHLPGSVTMSAVFLDTNDAYNNIPMDVCVFFLTRITNSF